MFVFSFNQNSKASTNFIKIHKIKINYLPMGTEIFRADRRINTKSL